jgi:FkbM family methyltransferase
MVGMSPASKALALVRAVRNWPLVVADKLGFGDFFTYEFRMGAKVVCRGRSSDINEAVAVLSGLEYPGRYLSVEPGGVVVDVGAHIGSFVLLFDALHRETSYRGFAFEPYKESFALLTQNVTSNGVTKFQLIDAAISDCDEPVYLAASDRPDAIAITDERVGAKVNCYRLSSFCEQNAIEEIDLLKVDAEGSEYRIFANDYDFIRESVKRIIVECHAVSKYLNLNWIVEKAQDDFYWKRIRIAEDHGGVLFLARRERR